MNKPVLQKNIKGHDEYKSTFTLGKALKFNIEAAKDEKWFRGAVSAEEVQRVLLDGQYGQKLEALRQAVSKVNSLIADGDITLDSKVVEEYKSAAKTLQDIADATTKDPTSGKSYTTKKYRFDQIRALTTIFNYHVYIEQDAGKDKELDTTLKQSKTNFQQLGSIKDKLGTDIGGLFSAAKYQETGHVDITVASLKYLGAAELFTDNNIKTKLEQLAAAQLALDNFGALHPNFKVKVGNETYSIQEALNIASGVKQKQARTAAKEDAILQVLKSGEFETEFGYAKQTLLNSKGKAIQDLDFFVGMQDREGNQAGGELGNLITQKAKVTRILTQSRPLSEMRSAYELLLKSLENATLEGSKNFTQTIMDGIEEKFLYNKITPYNHKTYKKKVAKNKRKRKKAPISNPIVLKRPASRQPRNKAGQFLNLQSLLGTINSKLAMSLRTNMASPNSGTDGALRYRSGRFAASVQATGIDSRGGAIQIFYKYMNNPYGTFAKGGRLYTPERDVNALIDKSVREVAQEIVAKRFNIITREA